MKRFLVGLTLLVGLLVLVPEPAEAQGGGGCGQRCNESSGFCMLEGGWGASCTQMYIGFTPKCITWWLSCLMAQPEEPTKRGRFRLSEASTSCEQEARERAVVAVGKFYRSDVLEALHFRGQVEEARVLRQVLPVGP